MMNEKEWKITIQIGKNLQAIRKLRGMTQEELAKTANITFQQIQKYENGTNRISGVRFVQFAKALSVSIIAFFDGIEEIQ